MPYHGMYAPATYNELEYPDTMYYFRSLNYGVFEQAPKSMYLSAIYFPADEYEFSAYVKVMIKGKEHRVYAEPVRFTVKKPEGNELLARQTYLELIPIIVNDYPNNKLIVEKVDNFLQRFDNSVFIDQVLRITKYTYFSYLNKSVDEILDFQYQQITKHPNFASNYERLTSIMSCYEQKKDSEGFLNMVNNLESDIRNNEIFNKVIFHIKRDFQRRLKENMFQYE